MPNSLNKVSASLIDTTKGLEVSLVDKYGPLMSGRNFAELLDIKEISVSNGFANNLPWTRPFRGARIKIGRRVYFNTVEVAEVLRQIQGKDSSGATTPVRQVCVRIGTRVRGEISRFNLPPIAQNSFGNKGKSQPVRWGAMRRFHVSNQKISASQFVLGAAHAFSKGTAGGVYGKR